MFRIATKPVASLVLSVSPGVLALMSSSGNPATAQESRALFDRPTVPLDPEEPPFRRMLDFDGDGDLDAVGFDVRSDREFYRYAVYANDGNGAFEAVSGTRGPFLETSNPRVLLEVGCLNNDAYQDFAIVAGNRFQVYLSQGDGNFTLDADLDLGAQPRAFLLSDVDRDGIDDLIWTDGLSLHVQPSTGANEAVVNHGVPGTSVLRVALGDGPNGEDIFFVGGLGKLQIIHGSFSGGLTLEETFQMSGKYTKMFDVGDVDLDGDQDLVLFGPTDYHTLRRDDADSWTLLPPVVGGPAEFLADVDQDGDLDGVCCGGGSGGPHPEWPTHVEASNFQVSINDGTGAFAPSFQIPGVGSPQLAGAVDVDGDGDADLVAGRVVYYSRGEVRPLQRVVPPVFKGPRDLADCDGDGYVDIGFSLESVSLGNGAGDFQRTQTKVDRPFGAHYVGPGYPGDFDGDGDIDLLVEQYSRPARPGPLSVHGSSPVRSSSYLGMTLLVNDGAGNLSDGGPAGAFAVRFRRDSLEAHASLVVDIEGDGDLDLFTRALAEPWTSQLFLNDGSGFFTEDVVIEGRVEAVADFSEDGVMDLLTLAPRTTTWWQPHLQGYTGVEIAGFAPAFVQNPSSCPWGYDPNFFGLNVDDYDGDGFPDFYALAGYSGENQSSLGILDGFGTSGESCSGSGGPGGGPMRAGSYLALGSLNGDGAVDAISGPLSEDPEVKVSVVSIGRDYGLVGVVPSFEPGLRQIMTSGLLVDVDSDGDLDVLGLDEVVLNVRGD